MTPDWRSHGPAYFELVDLTGISFESMHPPAHRGIHPRMRRRPQVSRPQPESRLVVLGGRVFAVLALVGCIATAGVVALR